MALGQALRAVLLLPENIERTQKEILKYHVVLGTVLSAELEDGQQVPSLQGETLDIGVDATGVTVNGVIVSIANVMADNGVIHVIDEILLPPSFLDDGSIIDTLFEGGFNADDGMSIYSTDILDVLLDFADLTDVLDGPGPFSTCILGVSRDLLCLRLMLTTSLFTINSLKPFLPQAMMPLTKSLTPFNTTLRRSKMWRL